MKEKTQIPETADPKDWRKELQGATPEKLARALLRPIGKTKTPPRKRT